MSIIKLAVSAFAITSLVVAVPTASTTGVSSTFSFSNWVESIIANPDGDNLSPEQVVEAWQASLNNTQADGALQKRFVCNTIAGTEASVPDAVWCINTLAKKGSERCRANAVAHFCTHGRAQITGVAGGKSDTTSSCNDVARGAGFVMDHCTRADNTVQGGEMAYGNGNMEVWIRKP